MNGIEASFDEARRRAWMTKPFSRERHRLADDDGRRIGLEGGHGSFAVLERADGEIHGLERGRQQFHRYRDRIDHERARPSARPRRRAVGGVAHPAAIARCREPSADRPFDLPCNLGGSAVSEEELVKVHDAHGGARGSEARADRLGRGPCFGCAADRQDPGDQGAAKGVHDGTGPLAYGAVGLLEGRGVPDAEHEQRPVHLPLSGRGVEPGESGLVPVSSHSDR